MTIAQEPIGSRFGPASTTDDVIAGIDLTGRNALVTGGNSGLGLETARTLADAGAHVIVADRELDTARAELSRFNAEFARVDLTDPATIDDVCATVTARDLPLHILVNAAGIMAPPLSRDSRGNERQLSTNHLGHFRLTAGLWPALARADGARVVLYSSLAHQYSPVDFEDPNYEKREYDPLQAYGQSKSAVALFAVELDQRAAPHGVRAFAVHPGNIASTGLGTYLKKQDMIAAGLLDSNGIPVIDPERRLKTPSQGAATGVWCATSAELAGKGGVYCEDCDIAPLVSSDAPLDFFESGAGRGVMRYAVDALNAVRSWALSEQLTGVRFLSS